MAPSRGSTSTELVQKGSCHQAIDHSHGGLITKIVALDDALGNFASFLLLPGQCHDRIAATDLIKGVDTDALLADKGFDNDTLSISSKEPWQGPTLC